jgi:hypothetical protein
MKRVGVEKARSRLEAAREALGRIRTSSSFSEFEQAWVALITALNTIHSTLEQSAKASPASDQWYGRKKHERKTDPLLQYLHQARNADEHGIEPIAEHVPGGMFIGAPGEAVHIDYMGPDGKGGREVRLKPVDGKLPTVGVIAPHPRLVPVRNRGVTYAPPHEHLGSKLSEASPSVVATNAVAYHEALLSEAEALVEDK